MFHWVENTFLTSKILEMEFLEKNRMTGTDSSVLNFDQNFRHNFQVSFGVYPLNK